MLLIADISSSTVGRTLHRHPPPPPHHTTHPHNPLLPHPGARGPGPPPKSDSSTTLKYETWKPPESPSPTITTTTTITTTPRRPESWDSARPTASSSDTIWAPSAPDPSADLKPRTIDAIRTTKAPPEPLTCRPTGSTDTLAPHPDSPNSASTGEPNSLRRRRRTATATEFRNPNSGIRNQERAAGGRQEALPSIWCRSQNDNKFNSNIFQQSDYQL